MMTLTITRVFLFLIGMVGVFATNAEASGSWSTQVGGNLRQLSVSDVSCESFEMATFVRVGRPAGFGVIHEYVGIVLEADGRQQVFVTGLNNDSDLAAFSNDVFGRLDDDDLVLGAPHFIANCSAFLATLERVNRLMTTSVYNDPIVYAAAMVSRPLTGQPCSNMADAVMAVLD